MSISRRLYLILGIMALLISAELTALWFTIHTLSAVRAYVGGEGLWSKAEKDAAYQLEAYARTRDPRDYQRYLTLLTVSIGDRQARLEMSKPNPDPNREFRGLVAGGNDPQDVPGMISLFVRFNRISYIHEAITDWTEGDAMMLRLRSLGATLHQQVENGSPPASISRTLDQIETVNGQMTRIEDAFSATLGEGSRWLTGLVLKILFGAALTVELSGLVLTALVTRNISNRLNAMLASTARFAKGDYTITPETASGDEIGKLSVALNSMARELQREQTRAATAFQESQAALREAQRVAHIGSWEWLIVPDVLACSKEFYRLFDVSPEDFKRTYAGLLDRVHPGDRASVDEAIHAMRRPGADPSAEFSIDHRIAGDESGQRWLCTQGRVICDDIGAPARLVGTTLDITDRKRSEERLEYLAQHDPLTNLPNRTLLIDRLHQAIALSQRGSSVGAVVFLDVDHFKTLNDTLGHAAGDRLLVAVADRLRLTMRETDTVARSGGDEFLIVLNGLNAPDGATVVARNIMKAFTRPFVINGHEMLVTASLGLSVFPTDGVDVDRLIRNADAAMYQAKQHGRNTFQFYGAAMHDQAVKQLALQGDMARALERGEFVLHYQPIVEIATGAIFGAEALVRWRQADGSLLPPGDFIPAAEESGLIIPLGTWVLNEACLQVRRWRDAGFSDLCVTVNVSALQMEESVFPSVVSRAVSAAGIEPTALQLEITESVLMEEGAVAVRNVQALRKMGVGVMLDDFGTGYSSLNYLKWLPVDAIKLDRAFIKDITADDFDQAVAESISALCSKIGLPLIAEGVETRAQLDLLNSLACYAAQGFCFSAALEPAAFDDLVRRWRRTPRIDDRSAAAG